MDRLHRLFLHEISLSRKSDVSVKCGSLVQLHTVILYFKMYKNRLEEFSF